VGHSEEAWFVEFYAPWCGFCKQFEPDYKAAAQKLKGVVKLGKVNCDEEKALATRFGINSFPTIKFYKRGSEKSDHHAV